MQFKNYSSPGALRASQLVTMFGPGAIVQMEHDSVLVMGIDTWSKKESYYKKLNHPYLQQLLEKKHFKMPRQVDRHRVISCRSFPLWGVCSNPGCARLQKHKAAPPDGKKFHCQDCNSEIYAAKFVVTCPNGHLDEFPWEEWAHSKPPTPVCMKNPRLVFRAYGKGPGLADYFVKCLECKASRRMTGVTSREGLAGIVSGCSGAMPWLGKDVITKCTDSQEYPIHVYGVQIRSTSMYYPVTISALHIPKWLHPIQLRITEKQEGIEAQLGIADPHTVAEKSPLFEKERETYSVNEIEKHIKKRFEPEHDLSKDSTEIQVRKEEYKDLILNEFESEFLEIAKTKVDKELEGYVNILKQIKRLTEIRVIRAFTRDVPADPYFSKGESNTKYCKISNNSTNWYPAVENRGEGFLFTLDEERLRKWEDNPDVISRCRTMINAFERFFPSIDYEDPRRPPRYALLHTLAHVLIRGVAELSGYNEASIRERIYSGKQHNGILLYTSTPSSDGSLGGLVRQGNTENFTNLIKSSVQNSMYCSRDPFCAEDNPEDMARAEIPLYARSNASACYGCVLLPETSCENVNRLLDRRLLFDEKFGYFKEWADLS